jgi:hypothetical protein
MALNMAYMSREQKAGDQGGKMSISSAIPLPDANKITKHRPSLPVLMISISSMTANYNRDLNGYQGRRLTNRVLAAKYGVSINTVAPLSAAM